jgi:hypothetical protein
MLWTFTRPGGSTPRAAIDEPCPRAGSKLSRVSPKDAVVGRACNIPPLVQFWTAEGGGALIVSAGGEGRAGADGGR